MLNILLLSVRYYAMVSAGLYDELIEWHRREICIEVFTLTVLGIVFYRFSWLFQK